MTTLVSEDEFFELYKPVVVPGSDPDNMEFLWDHKDTLGIPLKHVWTVMEHDDGNGASALPGYHIVNRIDYVVTEIPWEHEDISALWWEPRPLCQHCKENLDDSHVEGEPLLHSNGDRECEVGLLTEEALEGWEEGQDPPYVATPEPEGD